MNKIKSFEIYTDDEDKVLVGNSLETALEILENNDYIVEVEYENTPKEKVVINRNARPSVYFDGKEYHTIYHEYYGDGAYDNRKAIIFKKFTLRVNDNTYGVVMIKDGKIIEERLLKGHSEEYAEDCAENFVVGVI
tara:strand:+ start:148 stop:555 length:408 start_codon:yes stop_codon:yes gene_type:complete